MAAVTTAPDGTVSILNWSGFAVRSGTPEQPAAMSPSPSAARKLLRRIAPVALLFASTSILTGCASATPVPPPPIRPTYTYTVGSGDVLSISVWKESELTKQDVSVSPSGDIAFPLVGTLPVNHRTIPDVTTAIRAKLAEHLASPIVQVSLVKSNSSQIQVLGEVRNQQPVPWRDGLSLVQAISLAGGPTWAWAKVESCHIVRGTLDDPKFIQIDLEEVLKGNEKDVFLMPGDIVMVPPKGVTVYARWISQALAPIGLSATTAASAASTATTVGTTTLVGLP
jgi:polysaccharide export outer membrane protein